MANYGLMDQISGLKWNIQHFGGDPKSVTMFGYRNGDFCIHFLMQSPAAVAVRCFRQLSLGTGRLICLANSRIKMKISFGQAQPQFNSTQPQLKLWLRLVLFPPDPPTHPPGHQPGHPSGTVDSTLYYFMLIKDLFMDPSRLLKSCFKAASTPHQDNIKTSSRPIRSSSILTKVHLQAGKSHLKNPLRQAQMSRLFQD